MTCKAKIAATLGPASGRESTLTRMVDAGLDVARLNFSHGTADEHRRLVAELRKASRLRGRPVAVLADLQGPRFRVGRLPGGRVELETGTEVELGLLQRSLAARERQRQWLLAHPRHP